MYYTYIKKLGSNHEQYLINIKLNTLLDNKKIQYNIKSIRKVYSRI